MTAQIAAWQGLKAIGPIWRRPAGQRLRRVRARSRFRLERALRPAVHRSRCECRTGRSFSRDGHQPRRARTADLTSSRDGSYWNLVMPYAFASGFFPPGGAEATGSSATSRCTARACSASRAPTRTSSTASARRHEHPRPDGLGEIYGLSVSRFLADNDEPDQLALSLYGMLAIGMTHDTFVSGEAVSVVPLGTPTTGRCTCHPTSERTAASSGR